MKKVNFLFLMMVLLFPYNIHIRSQESDYSEVLSKRYLSPQLADIMRFDKFPNTQSLGNADVNIPLLNFNDKDFNINFSINYNSSGFKPNNPDNYVGLNWSLNGLGVIRREVRGVPDESNGETFPNVSTIIRGFYHLKNQSHKIKTTTPEDIVKNSSQYFSKFGAQGPDVPVINGTNIEIYSDVYHFTFGEHSGSFVLNFDGSISVKSNTGQKYEISLSGFYDQNSEFGRSHSYIEITTDDGFRYRFGGSYAASEYNAINWKNIYGSFPGINDIPSFPQARKTDKVIIGFYLSKITAPNGRELAINYFDPIQPKYHNDAALIFDENDPKKLINNKYNLCYSFSGYKFERDAYYSLVKNAIVNSIETDDKLLKFYFSGRKLRLYDEQRDTEFGSSCGAALDSMVLYNKENNKRIDATYLKYQYSSYSKFARMLLSVVSTTKTGSYRFDYNTDNRPVDPLTENTDHWGFWRGGDDLKNIDYSVTLGTSLNLFDPPSNNYRITTTAQDYDVFYWGEYKEPTGKDFDIFLLKKVYYPTGGFCEIEYEPHRFSSFLGYSANTPLNLYDQTKYYCSEYLKNNEGILVGGTRVKRLALKDAESNVSKNICYLYVKGNNNAISSGTLLEKIPLYLVSLHFGESPDYTLKGRTRSPALYGARPQYYLSEHIRYSDILEVYDQDLNIIEKKDSVAQYVISPLDVIREKKIRLLVGAFPVDLKHVENYSEWIITGGPGNSSYQGNAEVTITKGSTVIRKYSFKNTYSSITLNPLKELGEGTYIITMKADNNIPLILKTNYPNSGYKKIEVKGPYKQTKFSDFRTNPDHILKTNYSSYVFKTFSESSFIYEDELKSPISTLFDKYGIIAPTIDLSNSRGKILSETFYDNNGKILKYIGYDYQYTGNNPNRYALIIYRPSSEGYYVSGRYSHFQEFRLAPYQLAQKRTVEYSNPIQNTDLATESLESFKYDNYGYMVEQNMYDSQKGVTCTEISYTHQLPRTDPLSTYSFPTTISKRVINSQNVSNPISFKRNNYSYSNNMALLSSVETGLDISKLRSDINYLIYDKYGNPIFVQERGVDYVFLWSYQGKYPIAKIMNASYNEVKTALNGIAPESLSVQNTPNESLLVSLRNNLKSAQISTFLYYPFTGIRSFTSYDGIMTYFEYDKAGRLQERYILDSLGKKEILNYFNYQYATDKIYP